MKFSIIIPVYNVAPYLCECLDSVLAQTYADWEAICVDDGSTDGSSVILDDYAKRDFRFKVIHQENAGVSAARNRALEGANGAWVVFLDGDDLVRADWLSLLYNEIVAHPDCELVRFSYTPFDDGTDWVPENCRHDSVLVDLSKEVPANLITSFMWQCAFNANLIGTNRFEAYIVGEDRLFLCKCLSRASKLVSISDHVYGYRQRLSSAVHAPRSARKLLSGLNYNVDMLRVCAASGKKMPYIDCEGTRDWLCTLAILNTRPLSSSDCAAVVSRWKEHLPFIMSQPGYTRLQRIYMKVCSWPVLPSRVVYWLARLIALNEKKQNVQNVKTSEVSRNSGLDFFRCALMYLIVLYHCQLHGVWEHSRALWTVLFGLLTWHVDSFLAISGWFGVRFSWKKFGKLYATICFYSVLSIMYGLLFKPAGFGMKDIKIDGGWYGNTYIFLMILSPILNAGLESLLAKGKRALFLAWLAYAIAFTLQWSPIGVKLGICHSGESVFSLETFVFVYLTVRVLKLMDLRLRPSWLLLLGPGCYIVGYLLFAVFGRITNVDLLVRLHNYRAPYVWMMACAMLLFFVRDIRLPQWLGRASRFVAPSMFGVYLLHDTTCFGRFLITIPENYISNLGVHPLVAIFIASIVCFSVCTVIDVGRRMIIAGIERFWSAK